MSTEEEFLKILNGLGQHKEPANLDDTIRVGLAIEVCKKIIKSKKTRIKARYDDKRREKRK